jgi:predicted acyl esterase
MHRILTALLVLATALVGVSVAAPSATAAAPGFSVRDTTIPGDGGTPLRARVIQPTGRGPGPFPLLVLPTPWGVPNLAYVGAAAKLAYQSGYVVVAYTDRGFWDSGGEIQVAGPQDVADARDVIDWALRSTPADPQRIGMAGMSYGAGISMLTAAADRRVRAVAAMSGWADLGRSIYPNETLNKQGVEVLLDLAHLTGRPGPDLRRMDADYHNGDTPDAVSLTPQRSVVNKVAELNANRPAMLMANAFEDSFFAPSQMTDFFGRLTVPKQLLLSPGDHTTQELFGAAGLPNEIWEAVGNWFDRYLRGLPVDVGAPVQIKSADGGGWRSFPDWVSASTGATEYYLGGPGTAARFPATGALADRAATGWSERIDAGRDTVADSGTAFISGVLQGWLNRPVGVWTPAVNRSDAAVWAGPALPRATSVRGVPRVHLTVTPSAPTTSLFAYLYDVDALGRGALITHQPVTMHDVTPGAPRTVDLGLEPISWDVPAGHHLELVVDTVDPRYRGESQPGSTVTFGSPAGDPAWLRVPTG